MRIKRWLLIAVTAWVICVAVPTIPAVRVLLASPLVINSMGEPADACYVLASGDAFTERLVAAADLYQMHRVRQIILQRDDRTSYYNFVAQASWTANQWSLDALSHRGVPANAILVIDPATGMLGTLAEARNVSRLLPSDVHRLALVTSAPHMRRSLLTFRRILSSGVTVTPYPASDFASSAEFYRPIWLEYLKLGGYALMAWK